MRRILWNFGLFMAWLVAAMVYVTLQYTLLEYLWPSPSGVHGSFDGVFALFGCGVLALPLIRYWRGGNRCRIMKKNRPGETSA